MSNLEKTIARAFLEMADGLETGSFGPRPKIALTGMGSEHGEENAMAAATAARSHFFIFFTSKSEPAGSSFRRISVLSLNFRRIADLLYSPAPFCRKCGGNGKS